MNIKNSRITMARKILNALFAVLALQAIEATTSSCPSNTNCFCGGTFAVEVDCTINDRSLKIDIIPGLYVNIKCENTTTMNYNELPSVGGIGDVKTVSFKNCPLPSTSFKQTFTTVGVNKTMSLIFQNENNISNNFTKHHFEGLQDLNKLLLSVNGVISLPEDLFTDLGNLKWLNIKMKSANVSVDLFKSLPKLDTLEISHNQMTNIPDNMFEHLTSLRKFSLWQSNITTISKEFFDGMETLEELDLSSNSLINLPTEILLPLKNLNKLTLFSNKFSVLPENLLINNKLLSTLIILNNNMKIKELPRRFLANLPTLKQVHIQRCGIEILYHDVFINSSQLTNISLAHNEISNLPESIFNDQINLLDLDVSFNNLKELGIKLFSSLVKLERLNLCCNSITEIFGSTFSPLISLTYLNMERNKLKTISSNLFENNRQKIYITFASNELDFKNKILINNSWTVRSSSPFIHTYNLKMLNLSHNKFRETYKDWWLNGHEKVDIRFNFIDDLWDETYNEYSQKYTSLSSTPTKEIWVGNNNLGCGCPNLWFYDFAESRWKTKIKGLDFKQCPRWCVNIICYMAFTVIVSTISVLLFIVFLSSVGYFLSTQETSMLLKRICLYVFRYAVHNGDKSAIAVEYSTADEEFVLKEIVPGLNNVINTKLLMIPITDENDRYTYLNKFKKNDNSKCLTLVIFSSNYLMTTYSQVNIKRIREEMLKADNTLYVFVDTGPENSIFAFLKEQRDRKVSVLWDNDHFWSKVIGCLLKNLRERTDISYALAFDLENSLIKDNNKVKCESFMKLSDWPHSNTLKTFGHSQV